MILFKLIHNKKFLIGLACLAVATLFYYTFRDTRIYLEEPLAETLAQDEQVFKVVKPEYKPEPISKILVTPESAGQVAADSMVFDHLARMEQPPKVVTEAAMNKMREENALRLAEKETRPLTPGEGLGSGPFFTRKLNSNQALEVQQKALDQPEPGFQGEAGKPQLIGWKQVTRPQFDTGERVWAVLGSDLFVSRNRTMALLNIFDGQGRYLGRSIGQVRQHQNLEDRILIEGNEIIGENGARIYGNFQALSPDGSIGLVGDTRRHLMAYAGKTLYRTALGGLALSLGTGGNTLAGIIGAQAGTGILEGLNRDLGEGEIPRTVMASRGFRFTLLFLDPANSTEGTGLAGAGLAGASPSLDALDQLAREQDQARRAYGPHQSARQDLNQALNNPLAWMEGQR